MASIDGQHIITALCNAQRRLKNIKDQDNRWSCIAMALFFVDPYRDAPGVSAIKTITLLRDGLDKKGMNPFASYYIGWFDYSWFGSVELADEPEFFDRGYRAERAVFQRDFLRFNPTGYDLILCDVTDASTGCFRFSKAIHLSVSKFLALLPDMIGAPGEESPVAGTWTIDGGLLVSRKSVIGPFAEYLERNAQRPALYQVPNVDDYDLIPGDYGKVEA